MVKVRTATIIFAVFLALSIAASCGKNQTLKRLKAENKALKHQIDSLTVALDVCIGGIE